MKQIYKLIKMGVFPGYIHLYCGGKCSDAYKHMNKKFKFATDTSAKWEDGTGKSSHLMGTNHYFIWVYKKHAPSLAHEAVHIAMRMTEHLGPIFSPQVDEPIAYIVEYIVKEGLAR